MDWNEPRMMGSNYLVARRLVLFPIRTAIDPETDALTIGGIDLPGLAEEYGTPLYLYDQATILDAIRRYRQALERVYPGPSGLTYAGKAYLGLAIANWMSRQGLQIDCSSVQELHIAKQADVPRERLVFHGINKNLQAEPTEIRNTGIMVVDNLLELEILRELFRRSPQPFPQIWLRCSPGYLPCHIPSSHPQTVF